mgnify:FL=1
MAQIWQAGGARLLQMYLLLLSLAALIYWYADDSMRVVTALIAFCPCVFVLTGAAVDTSARSSLARRGMLVRSDSALEALGQTETIVFDVDALSRTDSLGADFPHIAMSLRHMGLHPALRMGSDADATTRISAAAGITDIRATGVCKAPYEKYTVLVGSPTSALHAEHPGLMRIHLSPASPDNTDAEAVLIGEDLRHLPALIRMARRTRTKIEQNAIFGHTLNLIALGLAAAGVLTPVTGALWHAASALILLLNAASLRSIGTREKKFAF